MICEYLFYKKQINFFQAYYFDQDDHYMPGFSRFFKKMAKEGNERAQKVTVHL